MQIAIDCRSLRKKPAGVPNFVIAFINELAVQSKQTNIYLLSNQDFNPLVKERLLVHPNIIKIIEPTRFFPDIANLWYLIKLPFILKRLKVDLFYTPIPNLPVWLPGGIKTLIAVNDMVYKRFPETMSSGNRLINFLFHDRSIKKADRIWAISNYTKSEVVQLFPGRKCKEIFVGGSIDTTVFSRREITSETKLEILRRFEISDKFLLFVGTQEPRKNLAFLLSFMPLLATHGYSLLLVGEKGWGKNELGIINQKDYPLDKIKFTGFVSTNELVTLYHLATIYISTSLNEGFGLPQLEAMGCGCPVVCPHNSAMIEVVEGAGETVKGWNKQEWVDTILKVSTHRNHYISKGLQRAQEYSWENVIKRIITYLS